MEARFEYYFLRLIIHSRLKMLSQLTQTSAAPQEAEQSHAAQNSRSLKQIVRFLAMLLQLLHRQPPANFTDTFSY